MHRDAEVVFFLGDGLSDVHYIMQDFPAVAWIAVRGNCDFTASFGSCVAEKIERITLQDTKIVLTHGDLYNAKYTTDRLKYLALSEGADVLLFGHTHTPYEEYVSDGEHPFYLFNPGSISASSGSYGILTLGHGAPFFSHGRINDL
jgi:putative phosphoesterase